VAYRASATVARALPAPVADAAARALGGAAPQAMGERRALVERNLQRAHGRRLDDRALRRAVRATFTSYARYWAESFRLPGTSVAELDDGMDVEGYEHLERALRGGTGTLMALPHLGGWEWAAFWLTRVLRIPVTAVVEPLEPPELFDWFVSFRESLGMEIVPLGPSAGTTVSKAVKRGDIIALLCDRDIQGGGPEVEFFGERTTLPGGPATLALRTGAPILPTAIYFDGERHLARVLPALDTERRGKVREDVQRITQDLAQALEQLISAAPEQWHLMSPNWPSDPGWAEERGGPSPPTSAPEAPTTESGAGTT
jgi:KDO2-lipid IV(A) lauroyltransferase